MDALPVCDTTMNAIIIGHADNEASACTTLRAHFGDQVSITGAKVADVLLVKGNPRHIQAWIPTT
jgi:hypothetical protein